MIASLKLIQDALGQLNDVAAHEQITAQIAHARAPSLSGVHSHWAFAAGLLLGEEEVRIDKLLSTSAFAILRYQGVLELSGKCPRRRRHVST